MNALADRRFQHVLGLSVLLHGALLVACYLQLSRTAGSAEGRAPYAAGGL